MTELTRVVGFTAPAARQSCSRRRLGVQLLATLALVLSLMIAAAAVSIGVARATTPDAAGGRDRAQVGVATVLGGLLVAMGGLTALAACARACDAGGDQTSIQT